MKTILKKTLIAALPLAGLLLTAPAAFAHIHHHHPYYWGYRHDCHPYYGRGWHDRGRYNNDYQPGWYGGRRYYEEMTTTALAIPSSLITARGGKAFSTAKREGRGNSPLLSR